MASRGREAVGGEEDARTLTNSRKREERVLLSMMACKGANRINSGIFESGKRTENKKVRGNETLVQNQQRNIKDGNF